MKAIRENIVGLIRFIGLLFSAFLLPQKHGEQRVARPHEQNKYEGIIGSPSVPLVPVETKFCPKCHATVCQVKRTKQGTEIIQNGRVLVTVGSNVTIGKDGKEMKGFPIKCPNGHTVRIE